MVHFYAITSATEVIFLQPLICTTNVWTVILFLGTKIDLPKEFICVASAIS